MEKRPSGRRVSVSIFCTFVRAKQVNFGFTYPVVAGVTRRGRDVGISGELLVPLIKARCLHYWSHKTLAFGRARGEGGREGGGREGGKRGGRDGRRDGWREGASEGKREREKSVQREECTVTRARARMTTT